MQSNAIYIYQLRGWPNFTWSQDAIEPLLNKVRIRHARLMGRMEGIGFSFQEDATLTILTLDVVKSSEIEGMVLDPLQVRSSIAKRLGIDRAGLIQSDRSVEGIVEMMLDATQQYKKPLTQERILGWQSLLFPTGWSAGNRIVVGAWRNNTVNDPMQVISGMLGREKVHFQAPDSALIPDEMYAFLKWFNEDISEDPLIKAAIAHLWFVTIHPFEDGNGRITRAIGDLQLARADGSSKRFYSMSAQIRKERNKYYDVLEQTQKGNLDITKWLDWFLHCLDRAIQATEETLVIVLRKAEFWKQHVDTSFNERQRHMLDQIMEEYEGRINSSNWAKKCNVSTDTAVRDIHDLVAKGLLVKGPEGGRSTNYLPTFITGL
ncbi:MAG: Fic family protein [Chitinophagaceae bacterium]|nr:Fic family protein [Chitinophagaceae bacterium]